MAKKRKITTIYKRKRKKNKKSTKQRNMLLLFVVLFLGIIVCAYFFKFATKRFFVRETSEMPAVQAIKRHSTVYASGSFRVPVLMYHYVENVRDTKDRIRVSLNIPPDIFEKQIRSLQEDKYTFLTMADVAEILSGQRSLPEKPVVLTFDDGYSDFYDVVFPLLRKYHIKSVAYIAPGLLGGPNYMSKEQVIEIANNGLVEIAAHTMDHRFLKDDTLSDAYYEIYESKNALETMIHKPVVSFAYPFGAFDSQAIELVKKAGFKTAVSTDPGVEITNENVYSINRIRPGIRVGSELQQYLQQSTFTAF